MDLHHERQYRNILRFKANYSKYRKIEKVQVLYSHWIILPGLPIDPNTGTADIIEINKTKTAS